MPIICHRINTIKDLAMVPEDCGVEIDVRFDTISGELYLHHDNCSASEIELCDTLAAYLSAFKWNPKRIVIFNIKDSGSVNKKGPGKDVEWCCIELAEKYGIPKTHYFLLDVEFPWIYYATKAGVSEIAIRFSEAEPLEQALCLKARGESEAVAIPRWVWIDTNTCLPINAAVVKQLKPFKTCLVCPERWGRPDDIEPYASLMRSFDFMLDAVMTNVDCVDRWRATGVIKVEL